jgi:hypothetical protein
MFTGHLAEHRASLVERLGPDAMFGLREVRWPLKDLRALADRVAAETGRSVAAATRVLYRCVKSGGLEC